MESSTWLAPGVPDDYYRRIRAAEEAHWWYRGMLLIDDSLLEGRVPEHSRILDAGCGTGGFLRYAGQKWAPGHLAGVDIAEAAIAIAREEVPDADLHVGPLSALPFDDGIFDLVVSHDVLQHVHEDELDQSVEELRRVLVSNGVLLVRTNGSRRLRRERADWRAFDAATLRGTLTRAGFRVERLTYASLPLGLWGNLRRKAPHAPTTEHHGIPQDRRFQFADAFRERLLRLEARYLAGGHRSIPYGHNLFAVASPAGAG